jgi:hypothetical protein
MKIVKIKLSWKDEVYEFDYEFEDSCSDEGIEFIWTEGNYACDCNRSLFIQRYCNPEFPELPCGDAIDLIEFPFKIRTQS